MKKILVAMVLFLGLSLSPLNAEPLTSNQGTSNTYYPIVAVEDWGPAVSKVVIENPNNIDYSVEDLKIKSTRTIEFEGNVITLEEGDLALIESYSSDINGNPGSGYTTVVVKAHPDYTLNNPLYFQEEIMMNNWVDLKLEVSYQGNVLWNKDGGMKNTDIEKMEMGSTDFTDPVFGDITLNYAAYTPETKNEKSPLIIWLHGMGEGGDDQRLLLMGNKTTTLVQDEIQDIFGGAYVLMPQAPTFWLDGGEGEFTETGESMYTLALMNQIEEYVAANPGIDTNRIYIGGESNGGFMTIRMLLDYPEYFAAAYPIAEAFYDEGIFQDGIATLREIPIWFTHAEDDWLAEHLYTATPTVERLWAAGAPNIHYTLYPGIVDTSGLINTPFGENHVYNGHFSWIPVLNNETTEEIDGVETTIWEWMSQQTLDNRVSKSYFMKDYGSLVISVVAVGAIVFAITRSKKEKDSK